MARKKQTLEQRVKELEIHVLELEEIVNRICEREIGLSGRIQGVRDELRAVRQIVEILNA